MDRLTGKRAGAQCRNGTVKIHIFAVTVLFFAYLLSNGEALPTSLLVDADQSPTSHRGMNTDIAVCRTVQDVSDAPAHFDSGNPQS